MATFETPNYIIGNSAVVQGQMITVLTQLDQALQALEPAPNSTTVQFNNSILLDNGAGNTITAGSNQINFVSAVINPSVISNSSGQDMNIASSASLNLYSVLDINVGATNDMIVNCGNTFQATAVSGVNLIGGALQLTSTVYGVSLYSNAQIDLTSTGNDITLNASGLANINLNAENINSYGYALPICFTTSIVGDSFSYNLGGQNFENVYSTSVNVPPEFVNYNPLSGFTSTKWKIDFALNCYNCSNIGDKGLGVYINFEDNVVNVYTPITYNGQTPFTYWNSYGYTNNPYSPFQTFNWSDFVDFAPLVGTGSSLALFLYFAADTAFNTKFNLTITLTRTNVI